MAWEYHTQWRCHVMATPTLAAISILPVSILILHFTDIL